MGLKHVIYCHQYFSSREGHQVSYVMTHTKQEAIHTETFLQFQDKRRWAVEETNISIKNIYIQHELQEEWSLVQF